MESAIPVSDITPTLTGGPQLLGPERNDDLTDFWFTCSFEVENHAQGLGFCLDLAAIENRLL